MRLFFRRCKPGSRRLRTKPAVERLEQRCYLTASSFGEMDFDYDDEYEDDDSYEYESEYVFQSESFEGDDDDYDDPQPEVNATVVPVSTATQDTPASPGSDPVAASTAEATDDVVSVAVDPVGSFTELETVISESDLEAIATDVAEAAVVNSSDIGDTETVAADVSGDTSTTQPKAEATGVASDQDVTQISQSASPVLPKPGKTVPLESNRTADKAQSKPARNTTPADTSSDFQTQVHEFVAAAVDRIADIDGFDAEEPLAAVNNLALQLGAPVSRFMLDFVTSNLAMFRSDEDAGALTWDSIVEAFTKDTARIAGQATVAAALLSVVAHERARNKQCLENTDDAETVVLDRV